VSPRLGGEAAKFGARFEGRWTTSYLLDVLMGRADRVTVEKVDPETESVEFFVLHGDDEEGHQVKRQWKDRVNWTVGLLGEQGILDDAARMVRGGRSFHFVSTLPARPISDLADAAHRADDYATFSGLISENKKLGDEFDALAKRWGGPQEAWEILRQVSFSDPGERQLQKSNAALAQLLFEGEPEPAAAVLAEVANDNLGVPLTADRLWHELEARGVRRNPLYDEESVASMVARQTDWFLASARTLLLQPPIVRSETGEAVAAVQEGRRLSGVVGEAGAGKSAVIAATVGECVADGIAVLAFRLDRFMEVRSTRQLGDALDLPSSPVIALGAAAAGRDALLVIDQLDAISLASGRSTEVFDVVNELLAEAGRFPKLRVLLACRRYDIDNDHRLRALFDPERPQAPLVVEVRRLEREQVARAVSDMGLNATRLDERQVELLSLPLNLVLLREVAGEADALSFKTTRQLLDLFWRTKRRAVRERRDDVRFERVIELLVTTMSSEQRLSISQTILEADSLDDDLDVLASEHLVVRDGRQVSFFHETLFDYAFARQWVARNESILDFLLAGEQELFRRAQVRQVLVHLRDEDRARFVRELRALLFDDRVRFHVKDSVLALVRDLRDPSDDELQVMLDLLDEGAPWRPRVELLLRTAPWFDRLDAAGLLATWLASGDAQLEGRAVTIMGAVGNERAGCVAQLLAPHAGHASFVYWLMWVARFTDLDKDRALFDLLLETTRRGLLDEHAHDLFLSAHSLGDEKPAWGVELLVAWLAERPRAFEVESGQVAALRSRDYGVNELIQKSGQNAPEEFVECLLPYMRKVMTLTERKEDALPRSDRHFSSQIWGSDLFEADDWLWHSMVQAVRTVAAANPERVRELVAPLVDDGHAAAQDLLYEAVTAAGAAHAEWAAELILRGGPALESGYHDSHYWRTRELLRVTGPHMSQESFAAVETFVAGFLPAWEQTHLPARGRTAFVLLSGLPEDRLSEAGRRKLGELRRKFEREEPEGPQGIRGGVVGPPIPEKRAEHMTDEQWLRAMRKHATDEGDWQTFDFRGGAYQLSHVLRAATVKEPERFARLALRLDVSFNHHYLQGILLGLGDTEEDIDPQLVYGVIRHAAPARVHDRWLAWPLKRLDKADIPDDIIELILARALGVESLADLHQRQGA
jgi:hypothetical protein